MKKNFLSLLSSFLFFVSCTNGITSCAENKKTQEQFPGQMPGQTSVTTDDGSTTNYTDKTTAPASAVIAEDLYENFVADGTVKITFMVAAGLLLLKVLQMQMKFLLRK